MKQRTRKCSIDERGMAHIVRGDRRLHTNFSWRKEQVQNAHINKNIRDRNDEDQED